MKRKIRLLSVTELDQKNLENLLNAYADKGWHLKAVKWQFLIFEEDLKRDRRYSVLVDYSKFPSNEQVQYKIELVDQLMYLEDFDVNEVLRMNQFVIVDHPASQPLITDVPLDETVSKPKRTLIKKAVVRSARTDVIMYLWMLGMFYYSTDGFSTVVLSNVSLATFALIIVVYGYTILSQIKRIIKAHQYETHYTLPFQKKFMKTHNTLFEMGRPLMLLSLILVLMSTLFFSTPLFTLILLIAVFVACFAIWVIYLFINSEGPLIKKCLVYLLPLVSFILVTSYCLSLMNTIDLYDYPQSINVNDITAVNLTSLEQFVSENEACSIYEETSILAGKVSIFCEDQSVTVYHAKTPQVMPFVIKGALDTWSMQKGEVIPFGPYDHVAYRMGNTILVSDSSLPDIIMNELKGS